MGQQGTQRWRRAAAVVVATALLVLAVACGGDDGASGGGSSTIPPATTGAPTTWPDTEWSTTTPAAAGLAATPLEDLAAEAEATGGRCLVVVRGGEIVDERSWGDADATTPLPVFSVTKSIAATLVGIAQDRGLLDIDDAASEHIPEWVGTPSEDVTIRDLLSMDSGRASSFDADFVELIDTPDATAYAVGVGQDVPPGTRWTYSNTGVQALDAVLTSATGVPTHEFAREALFDPIGADIELATDAGGSTLLYSGALTTCRDLARLGLLHVRGGEWDGEQVVSSAWIDEATRPSQDLNPGYGLLWWLYGTRAGAGAEAATGPVPPAVARLDHDERARMGSAPAPERFVEPTGVGSTDHGSVGGSADRRSLYAARGLGDQLLVVFPDEDVVAVRIGAAPTWPRRLADVPPVAFGVEDVAAAIARALA